MVFLRVPPSYIFILYKGPKTLSLVIEAPAVFGVYGFGVYGFPGSGL